jgi:hypothetical protein
MSAEKLYRHKKRGTVYRITGFGTLQIDGPSDMAAVVIYHDVANPNRIWVRPHDMFFDGRFEEFEASQEDPLSEMSPFDVEDADFAKHSSTVQTDEEGRCPTLGAGCRGCPDCKGSAPGSGWFDERGNPVKEDRTNG